MSDSKSSRHNLSGPRKTRIRNRLIERDGWNCWYCLACVLQLTIDHIIPRSEGGSNGLDNMVLACFTCNQFKADRLLEHPHRGMWKDAYF